MAEICRESQVLNLAVAPTTRYDLVEGVGLQVDDPDWSFNHGIELVESMIHFGMLRASLEGSVAFVRFDNPEQLPIWSRQYLKEIGVRERD